MNTHIFKLQAYFYIKPLILVFSFLLSYYQVAAKCMQGNIFQKKPLYFNKVIHIKDFGAIANGKADCTSAFQKASHFLQANGGTLVIDPGVYRVGRQRFTNNYYAGSSFFDHPILSFKNVEHPIIILGYKAILKANDALKYGSFNPVSGQKDSIRKLGNRSDYYASAFTFINAIGCSSITIKGLTLDGNSGKLVIGPAFGEEGIQLAATGISVFNNKNVNIADCTIQYCALDALIIGWTGLKNTDPIYPHTIKNVMAKYNGRQGLSWVGGNNLQVNNSTFSFTGKGFNKGVPVVSKPSAGIDIEIENSIIKNGSFTNCVVNDNAGPGLSTIGHDTYNIKFKKVTFIGTTNSAAYPKSQGLSFDSCIFVGKVERIFGSEDKNKAISFKNCLFTMENSRSPTGKVFGDYCEFYEGKNVVFENCEFNAADKQLPVFNHQEIVFINCKFYQNSDIDFNASAFFKGTTQFIMKGKGKVKTGEAGFEGIVFYNNKKITQFQQDQLK